MSKEMNTKDQSSPVYIARLTPYRAATPTPKSFNPIPNPFGALPNRPVKSFRGFSDMIGG